MPTYQQTVTRGFEYCIPKERLAGAEIDAGAVAGLDGNGDLVPAQDATTGTDTLKIVTPMRELGMGDVVNTTYPVGEPVKYVTPPTGTEVMLNLEESQTVNDGEAVVLGAASGEITAFDGAGGDTADMVIGVAVPGTDQDPGFEVTTGAGETADLTVEVK